MGGEQNETLTQKQFDTFSKFIEDHCGIKMPPAKKLMLESRLKKRLKILSIKNFDDYIKYVFSDAGMSTELVNMIDVVTTNKTDFFREPQHFDFLVKKAIPDLVERSGAGVSSKFMVWSAGCSTGEEPYTLSIVLSEVQRNLSRFDFMILGTDISTDVLKKAQNAIYEEDKVAPIPLELKKRYLLKSRDRDKALIRIAPELREKVKFRRLNFMDNDYGVREKFDIIFCRNVFIYFDRQTQESILLKFVKNIAPGGYIFLGHSESINGLNVPLMQVAPSVYRCVR